MMDFWSQIQAFLLFQEILQLEKFEGAGFKYNNIIFKFQPKNTQMMHFWSHILRTFIFYTKLCDKGNSRALMANMIMVFLKLLLKILK